MSIMPMSANIMNIGYALTAAFGGLLALAREGVFAPGERVLFLHSGGAGGLFAPDDL